MAIFKLNTLSRWNALSPETGAVFKGVDGEDRLVRINVNCEAVTSFSLVDAGDRDTFLVTVEPGVHVIEFYFPGTFRLIADAVGAAVMFQSADLEPTFSEIVDPKIFTKIAQRRHRNRELEEIMYRMQQNVERRFASQAHEMEAAFERRAREIQNGRPAEIVVSNAPGAAASGGGAPVPAQGTNGEEPAPVAAAPAVGESQTGVSSENPS